MVELRWFVVLGWLALVGLALITLPTPSAGGGLGNLLPSGSAAIAAQERSLRSFDIPLTTGTVVVLRNPGGMSALTTADVALYALSIDQRLLRLARPYPEDRVLGALPIIDPGGRTTAATYLYFAPGASITTRLRLAGQYAAHFHLHPGVRSYVTGLVPAEQAQTNYLTGSLFTIEVATLGLVALIVG